MLDLVGFPRGGGGLSNIATVIGDLLVEGVLAADQLVDATVLCPVAVVQRVGHLVGFMAHETNTPIDLDALAALVSHAEATPLDPGSVVRDGAGGSVDRWQVRRNTQIEHDL